MQTATPETKKRPAKINAVADRLDQMIEDHLANMCLKSDLFQLLTDPKTTPQFAACLMRHAMAESYAFTPRMLQIMTKAIGMMPHSMPNEMRHAFNHVREELDHSDMALRTCVELGGDEQWVRTRQMTPATFAMVAACDAVVEKVSGVAYLGFTYAFESTTPVLSAAAIKALEAKGIKSDKREFLNEHAEVDIAHQRSIRNLIGKVCEKDPKAGEQIIYSAEVAFAAYPIPIWQAVVQRAKVEMAAAECDAMCQ